MAPATKTLAPIGFRKDGRLIFPIMGGDESAEAEAQAAAAAAASAAAEKAASDAAAKAASEKGYPENTPLAEMNDSQQAAYWKDKSRQHESRNKALGVTPEQLQELRDKAQRADQLEYDLASDKDKAVADAKKTAETESEARNKPALIEAKLDAAAARAGVTEEDLTKAVEFIDTSKFLANDGTVDTDKVKAFIATITPATGNQQQQRRGPDASANGRRGGQPGDKSVASGKDLFAQMHPKKAS